MIIDMINTVLVSDFCRQCMYSKFVQTLNTTKYMQVVLSYMCCVVGGTEYDLYQYPVTDGVV